MIYKKMSKVTELDMSKLYFIKGELNKITTQSNKDLKNSFANIINDYLYNILKGVVTAEISV